LLGRGSPLGIVLAAILFGTLEQAGLAINAVVPKDAMIVLQAVVILLVATANAAVKPKASAAPQEPSSPSPSKNAAARASQAPAEPAPPGEAEAAPETEAKA
ncbi:MAG TPA: hypothetical protein VK459_21585, partial [Polyangiaceae bacterium]|nr:hypothetical protein [Polyangiaceae bacterium]